MNEQQLAMARRTIAAKQRYEFGRMAAEVLSDRDRLAAELERATMLALRERAELDQTLRFLRLHWRRARVENNRPKMQYLDGKIEALKGVLFRLDIALGERRTNR